MDTESIPGKTIALVVVAFLFLAGVHLWWQGRERNGRNNGEPVIDRARVEGGDRQITLGERRQGEKERKARREEMRRLLTILKQSSDVQARRSAALRLQYLADSSAEPELLKALKSRDEIVARRCADALLDLWQKSESHSVNRMVERGITAYENGEFEEALNRLNMSAELDPDIPDLHRLRAEILLARGEENAALKAGRKALKLESHNFMAHHVMAKAYRRQERGDAALDAVNRAIEVYPGYEPANELKAEILSLQKAGEL